MLQVVVFLSVWSSVAHARGGSVAGYDAGQFAGYFIVVLVVRELTYTWTPWVFAEEVQSGNLASKLMIPLHPVWRYATDTAVFKLQGMLVVVPALVALTLAFHPTLHPTLLAVASAIPIIMLGAAVRFAADWTVAQAAFWLTRLDGVRNTYYIALLFLGGQFAPINVLPEPLRIAAKALPFYWTLGFPVELVLGSRRQQPGRHRRRGARHVAGRAHLCRARTVGPRYPRTCIGRPVMRAIRLLLLHVKLAGLTELQYRGEPRRTAHPVGRDRRLVDRVDPDSYSHTPRHWVAGRAASSMWS